MYRVVVKDKQKLVELRIRKGLSIKKMSEIAGLSTATVFRIETDGDAPMPSTAKKICDALGVEFDEVFKINKEEE